MRTQVYAALIAVVAAGETPEQKKVADAKKASEVTIKADLTACHDNKNADGYKKCHWYKDSCYDDDSMKKYTNC